MPTSVCPHISVCICTYKRTQLLRLLLHKLFEQRTDGLFTYSLVIADNDAQASGRDVVAEFQSRAGLPITYSVEPEQNIAMARNKALANATGDYVAFIDDDEVPLEDWLLRLFETCQTHKADGVLGPVRPYFAVNPPEWAVRAGFFDRPNSRDYQSGSVLHWNQTGTGNALIRRGVFDELDFSFRAEFGSGGEDVDFFHRAMDLGNVFVWCAEAVAYELIPIERTRVSFQLRRALLRGQGSVSSRPSGILKPIVACGLYTLLLPLCLLMGRHVFLKYLVKTCDHLGRVLGLCGIKLVREKYVGSESNRAGDDRVHEPSSARRE
jgi:succinoglycan biosynthesis protein ExoM